MDDDLAQVAIDQDTLAGSDSCQQARRSKNRW
jgi:hypothetical protein